MSIPRGLIRKLAISDNIYTKGLSLAHSLQSVQTEETAFYQCYHAQATFRNQIKSRFFIDHHHELIEDMNCTCDTFKEGKGACEHVVALLIKLENDFFSDTPEIEALSVTHRSIKTDKDIKVLMKKRASELKAKVLVSGPNRKASLIPYLQTDAEGLSIGFKIRNERIYLVKNLAEFNTLLQGQKYAPCGKTEDFFYAEESFFNKELVQFFIENFPLCPLSSAGKTMHLSPRSLDSFFKLFSDEKITLDGENILLKPYNPSLTLLIKSNAAFYRLSLSERDFSVISGQNQLYLLKDDVLYLCDQGFTQSCKELLSLCINNKKTSLIHKKDMPGFYNLILNPASAYLSIEADSDNFLPPALEAKIYLDLEAGKRISAKIQFCYGEQTYDAFSQGRSVGSVMDVTAETKIEELIREFFPRVSREPGVAEGDADSASLFHLIHEGIPSFNRLAQVYVSKSLKAVKVKPFPDAKVGVRIEADLLKLDFLAKNLSLDELTEAILAYRQKKQYIRLKNGSFLLLASEKIKHLNALTEGLGLSERALKDKAFQAPLYRALYLNAVTSIKIEKDQSFLDLLNGFSEIDRNSISLPHQLDSVLRPYQKVGYRWLKLLTDTGFGGILADDMGLGKTLQILTLISAEKAAGKDCKTIVVCPASLVLNWECEIKRFTPQLSALCVIGNTSERSRLLKTVDEYDVLITSYDMLKRDILLYHSYHFAFEIIDEAQLIKNHKTQNAKAVKGIHAKTCFALTGTPIENSLAELWSIFDFLMPGYLYKYSRFRNLFEAPIVKEHDKEALEELKKLTLPFILRRLKKEVLKELPEKTETVLYTKLAEEQEKLYDANLLSMQSELKEHFSDGNNDVTKNRIVILSMLTRLRQICCDPTLIYENYKEQSGKLDLCLNLIENVIESGHKLLLFSQFTGVLSILERELKQIKIPYYLLKGSTSKEERMRQVSAFNKDETPVFLISLKAGGTGLNLTGADVVIHYDPWWNLSVRNQATDRSHRIGQKKHVQVYQLIAKGTIEEKIMDLAEKKQSLADSILPDNHDFLKNLSKDQILNLFDL